MKSKDKSIVLHAHVVRWAHSHSPTFLPHAQTPTKYNNPLCLCVQFFGWRITIMGNVFSVCIHVSCKHMIHISFMQLVLHIRKTITSSVKEYPLLLHVLISLARLRTQQISPYPLQWWELPQVMWTAVVSPLFYTNFIVHSSIMHYWWYMCICTAVEDYTPNSTSFTFNTGDPTPCFAIMIVQDADLENCETFDIEITTTDPNVFLALATATVTIYDDDGMHHTQCTCTGYDTTC